MFKGNIHCNVGYKICFKIPALSSLCKACPNVSDWCLDFYGLEMGLNELFARLTFRENLNLLEVVCVFPG